MVKWIKLYEEYCKGCGICAALCPRQVLGIDDLTRKVKIVNLGACTGCLICETHCPDFAISIGEVKKDELLLNAGK